MNNILKIGISHIKLLVWTTFGLVITDNGKYKTILNFTIHNYYRMGIKQKSKEVKLLVQ